MFRNIQSARAGTNTTTAAKQSAQGTPLMSKIKIASIATLASLAIAASAADPSFGGWDVRLGIGLTPGVKQVEVVGAGDNTFDFSASTSMQWALGANYTYPIDANWGLVVGPNIIVSSASGDGEGDASSAKWTVASYGLELVFGAAYKIDQHWKLELTPFLGYGAATSTLEVGGNSEDSDSISLTDYGIKFAGIYSFDNHIMLGADVGYKSWNTGAATFTDIDGNDFKASGSGATASIFVGYAF